MKQKISPSPRIDAVRIKYAAHQRTQKQSAQDPTPLSDTQRRSELARMLPLWPKQLADLSIAGRRYIIRTVERALRAERKRGRDGHWAYDLARHAALIRAWRQECASLRVLELSSAGTKPQQKSPPEGGPV